MYARLARGGYGHAYCEGQLLWLCSHPRCEQMLSSTTPSTPLGRTSKVIFGNSICFGGMVILRGSTSYLWVEATLSRCNQSIASQNEVFEITFPLEARV